MTMYSTARQVNIGDLFVLLRLKSIAEHLLSLMEVKVQALAVAEHRYKVRENNEGLDNLGLAVMTVDLCYQV